MIKICIFCKCDFEAKRKSKCCVKPKCKDEMKERWREQRKDLKYREQINKKQNERARKRMQCPKYRDRINELSRERARAKSRAKKILKLHFGMKQVIAGMLADKQQTQEKNENRQVS